MLFEVNVVIFKLKVQLELKVQLCHEAERPVSNVNMEQVM